MVAIHSSQKIEQALSQQFKPLRGPFKVKMRNTKEIGLFIKKVESAQRAAENSKLVFK